MTFDLFEDIPVSLKVDCKEKLPPGTVHMNFNDINQTQAKDKENKMGIHVYMSYTQIRPDRKAHDIYRYGRPKQIQIAPKSSFEFPTNEFYLTLYS